MDPATSEIYTLSLHDALPIFKRRFSLRGLPVAAGGAAAGAGRHAVTRRHARARVLGDRERIALLCRDAVDAAGGAWITELHLASAGADVQSAARSGTTHVRVV